MAKKISKKSSKKPRLAKRPAVDRPFPRHTIEEALRVVHAIKDKNNGKPFLSEDVAKAMGLGSKGTQFFYLSAASRDYGLSIGTRDSEKIELTELGRRAAYPASAEERRAALFEAFRSVEVFSKVFDHYDGTKLPEMEYLSNTLSKEFGIDPQVHDEFVRIYTANCDFLNIDAQDVGRMRRPAESTGVIASADVGTTVVEYTSGESEDSPLCFVILPFSERDPGRPKGFFDEVLRNLILPAAKQNDFRVRTAKKSGSDVIQRTIIKNLLEADLVVADLTEHNPNVMFELGVRIAQEKPVAILKSADTGPLFDVDHMVRVYSYNPCLWPSTVKEDLPNIVDHIRETWRARELGGSYLSLLKG